MNYEWIGEAVKFYTGEGFQYIDVPWTITDEAMGVTLPKGVKPFACQDGPLVGSAEQSFIQMMIDGTIKRGLYVAVTPCFRLEEETYWNKHMFMKVELIAIGDNRRSFKSPDEVAQVALRFFKRFPKAKNAEIVTTPEGYDIELGGIEIGSYGRRKFRDFEWIYGTGLAEPRFSLALSPPSWRSKRVV